jgi:predicted membrane protein DUF2339
MSEMPQDDFNLQRLDRFEKQLEALTDRMSWLERYLSLSMDYAPPSEAEQAAVSERQETPADTYPDFSEVPLPQYESKSIPIKPDGKTPLPDDIQYSEQPERASGFDLRGFLERVELLPPRGEGSVEVQLGLWWATRIGILLAVITGVFFAVYVSQNAAPWVRFIELLAASLAFTGLGLWLQRRHEKFGEMIFAGGLALLYFTIYAGYAVPPIRVITNPLLASILLLLTVSVIVACAFWRRSMGIATMAVLLGYVACIFSFVEGLNDFALNASLVLAVAAAGIFAGKRWVSPLLISVPMSYLIYALILLRQWQPHETAPSFWICLAYLVGYLLVFSLADFQAVMRKINQEYLARRFIQIANTTGAVGLGFIMTYDLYHEKLSTFFFLLGAILVGFALLYYVSRHPDVVMHNFFIKGSALFTLGIMTEFDARTRWSALALESIVLLFSAKRSRLRIVEGAMVLIWLASFAFFVHHTVQLGYFIDPYKIISSSAAASLLYLIFSGVFFCLQGRWLSSSSLQTQPEITENDPAASAKIVLSPRVKFNIVYSLFLGCIGILIARAYISSPYFPLGLAGIAFLTALIGFTARHWIPLLAAFLPLIASHLAFWFDSYSQAAAWVIWINALVVIILMIVAATALFIWSKSTKRSVAEDILEKIDFGLHFLWIFTLQTVFFKTLDFEWYLLAQVITSLLLAACVVKVPFSMLGNLTALPMVLALIGLWSILGFAKGRLPYQGQEWLLWIAMFGAFVFASVYARFEVLPSRYRYLGNKWKVDNLKERLKEQIYGYDWFHILLAMTVGGIAFWKTFDHKTLMLVMAVAAFLIGGLSRWPGLKPACLAAILYTIIAHCMFYHLTLNREMANETVFFWMSISVAVITTVYAALRWQIVPNIRSAIRQPIQWLHGALALGLLYTLFYYQQGALKYYITALMGLAAVSVLIVGLAAKVKPYRILGLIGLALCIPRVFVVDVQSTLYRIIAFGGLSIVLLIVGFLYHKFRDVLQRLDEQEDELSNKKEG